MFMHIDTDFKLKALAGILADFTSVHLAEENFVKFVLGKSIYNSGSYQKIDIY